MNSHRTAALVLWAALVVAAPARSAEPNAIRGIDVQQRDGAVEIAIQGSRAPSYTVFRLQDPPRLVVDLAGADVSAVTAPVKVGQGGVASISAAQYADEHASVGRVVVALDAARPYEVVPSGDAILVRVLPEGAEPNRVPVVATAPATSTPSPTVTNEAAPPERSADASAAARSRGTDPHLVSRRLDEASAARPARALRAVRATKGAILLATDGDVGTIEVIELRDPARLAIDLLGVEKAPRAPVKVKGAFSQVRFGADGAKVRVVLDVAGEMPRYEVKRVPGGVAIALASGAPASAAAPAVRPAAPVTAPAPPADTAAVAKAPVAPERVRIGDVKFAQHGSAARIEIAGRPRYAVTRPDARTVVLSLEGAELPKRLERSLDTSAFQGPVLMVSSFNQPSTGQVKVVATLRSPAVDHVVESGSGLAWTFTSGAATAAAPAAAPASAAKAAEAQAAGFAAEAPAYALSGAPQARGYTGRRITLDFHDIEIRNLLRLIADVSKKNIVVADDVKGTVTVSLRNVPWDQALELILKTKGLGKEELGNVIRIARYEDIAKEQQARMEAEKAKIPLMPLKVRLIPVNFARAGEVASRVKDVLTERGTVSTDERTNVLIVKDVPDALVRAEGLVRNLDTEIPQVLIESRIVEATSNFNRALGVQWGGNAGFTQTSNNPTGMIFPSIANATGAAGGGPTTGTAAAPNYAVNLPAPIAQGAGGGIGFTFGSVGGAVNLNLRLSALENSGVVKTISSPRIATIDNREATIGQGLSIPFSQVSASGVNTVFIEAKLELKVTPHVSADGSILLKIKATNNQPNPQLTGSNGQPSISKREAETEVLVKDGETTVIGGIYTRQTANKVNEVPFLGKLPILGYLFRSTTDSDDHTELLIFITPRILNKQATTVAGAN